MYGAQNDIPAVETAHIVLYAWEYLYLHSSAKGCRTGQRLHAVVSAKSLYHQKPFCSLLTRSLYNATHTADNESSQQNEGKKKSSQAISACDDLAPQLKVIRTFLSSPVASSCPSPLIFSLRDLVQQLCGLFCTKKQGSDHSGPCRHASVNACPN